MHTSILNTLEALQLTSHETKEIYSHFTRDKELIVWRDRISHVIFIDGYYVGDEVYTNGGYHKDLLTCSHIKKSEQPNIDNERRFKQFLNMIKDSQIADFGCGEGKFLMKAKRVSQSVLGVELQTSHINHLRKADIPCHNSLDGIPDHSLDTCFMFHVFEHLPDPLQTLLDIRCKLKNGGNIVIEVPHARDFLLEGLKLAAFKEFTLWSQHLILHTRVSLHRILHLAGYINISVDPFQRYPLSNHFNWLSHGKPGVKDALFESFDTPDLLQSYSDVMADLDMTDTLIATAQVPNC